MIRPYFAVIQDSFRAAIASRVLLIALLLIVVVLLALVPFHAREQVDWQLNLQQHISQPDRLARRLVDEGKSGSRTAVARIWDRLSEDIQQRIENFAGNEENDQTSSNQGGGPPPNVFMFQQLVKEFNDILTQRDFYDEEAFAGKRIGDEATALVDKGVDNLSDIEVKRLNRLLVSTALRRDVQPPGASQLDFYYWTWHWSAFTTSVSHSQFAAGLSSQLPGFFDKFVMSIGIFIAILVTASIIPEMLEPGSLNLLLSKPIHRWGLLITKFIGGCSFILLCATLFFVGIYFWLGIQIGVWERAVLLSIPIYVLVFAMYYSVSVLAGILFRSPILCISFAILFWAICWGLGFAYNRIDNRLYNAGPMQVVPLPDNALYVDVLQKKHIWDGNGWKQVHKSSQDDPQAFAFEIASYMGRLDGELADLPGPVYDAKQQTLIDSSGMIGQSGQFGRLKMTASREADQWKSEPLSDYPQGTIALFVDSKNRLLAVTSSGGVFRFKPDEEEESKKPAADEKTDGGNGNDERSAELKAGSTAQKAAEGMRNLFSTATKSGGKFEKVMTPNGYDIRMGTSVSLHPDTDQIAFYSEGWLTILQPTASDEYEVRVSRKVGEHDSRRMTSFVKYSGDAVFVAFGNGRIYHLNAGDLTEISSNLPETIAAVRNFTASPNGRYAVAAFRNGRLWLYDAQAESEHLGSQVGGQGDLMAAEFDADGSLWVADRFCGANRVDIETLTSNKTLSPRNDWLVTTFRYGLRPLYSVFPKPSEFYKVISLLSASADVKYNPDVDLVRQEHRTNPWSPLRNGIAFMIGMLVISCLIFQRQDF